MTGAACPTGPRRTRLTPDQLRAWEQFHAKYRGYARRGELTVAYARAQRGLTLEFLKLLWGPEFGEPTMWSIDACAEQLRVPQSDLEEILRQLGTWTEPQLRSDPEWRALKRRLPDVAAEIVGPERADAFVEPRGFSHLEFSDAACRAVLLSPEIAKREGGTDVRCTHLQSAIDEADRTTHATTAAPSVPFAPETSKAVADAMRLGHEDQDTVELEHLRAACAAAG